MTTAARGTCYRIARSLLVALPGALAACARLPAPQVQPQVHGKQAAQCDQAPLEEALAYDDGSNWFNVGKSCPDPSQPTGCIQKQIDQMLQNPDTTSHVIYFPNGTYTIDQTLTFTGMDGVTLMGQDPAQTVIAWGGEPAQSDPPLAGSPIPSCAKALSDGQDPACDIGNMIHIDGSINMRIMRLTFDGQLPNNAGTAKAILRVSLYQNFDKKLRNASTANEYSDLILRHARYGIRAAIPSGSNDAENFVRRARFENLEVGFSAESDNCLNNNIWDSYFFHCGIGVQALSGSFNVYNSTFVGSKADLVKGGGHTGFDFVIQGNTSVGSSTFFAAQAGLANLLIQDNHISVTGSTAIDLKTPQNALVLNNVIQTAPPDSTSGFLPIVVWNTFHLEFPQPASHVISGNVFSAPQADAVCAFRAGGGEFGKREDCWAGYLQNPLQASLDGGYFYGNTFDVSSDIPAPPPPTAPAAKALLLTGGPGTRVPACNGAAGCSDADNINQALLLLSTLCGQRPILHLPAGLYRIRKTLVLPNGPAGQAATGCPIQIFGDGASLAGTVLEWDLGPDEPGGDGYMFELPSPAQAVIQDLAIANANGFGFRHHPGGPKVGPAGRGILVHSADDPQAGGVIYLNQVNLVSADSEQRPLPEKPQPEDNVGFISAGFDHLNIEAEQSGFGGGDTAIRIIGGGAGAAGMDATRAARFRGVPLSAIYQSQFDVRQFGNLYVAGLDAEGYTHGIRLDAPGASGRLTVATGHIGGTAGGAWQLPPAADAGKILVGDFAGEVNLFSLTTSLPVRVTAKADAAAHVLGFGMGYSNFWAWNWDQALKGWVTNPESGSWNGDGPPSPLGSYCADAQGKIDPAGDVKKCMTVVPQLRPQAFKPAPDYVDCAGYAAWNVDGTPLISYDNVWPTPEPPPHYQPTGQGVFYVEGATPAGHTWFLSDKMANYDFNDKNPEGDKHVATRCGDISPPLAPANTVPVIDAALEEIRKDTTAVPHPCKPGATDVRIFRVHLISVAPRTGLAVMP
jgi:hypothetical protein